MNTSNWDCNGEQLVPRLNSCLLKPTRTFHCVFAGLAPRQKENIFSITAWPPVLRYCTSYRTGSFINYVTRDAALFHQNLPLPLSSRSTFSDFVASTLFSGHFQCISARVTLYFVPSLTAPHSIFFSSKPSPTLPLPCHA